MTKELWKKYLYLFFSHNENSFPLSYTGKTCLLLKNEKKTQNEYLIHSNISVIIKKLKGTQGKGEDVSNSFQYQSLFNWSMSLAWERGGKIASL